MIGDNLVFLLKAAAGGAGTLVVAGTLLLAITGHPLARFIIGVGFCVIGAALGGLAFVHATGLPSDDATWQQTGILLLFAAIAAAIGARTLLRLR